MARGRRRIPDEVKAAKGNPGKRKLLLADNESPRVSRPLNYTMPETLTHEREQRIFREIVEDYLQRRVARPQDLFAYARWAHYVHRWMICKETLDQPGAMTVYKSVSPHGTYYRRNPIFKDQLDVERVLQSLEDRLGLNPAARQNIIRGLAAMPAALGSLFGDEDSKQQTNTPSDVPDEPALPVEASPLNFLSEAGGQKLN